jgi:uncharacterized protein YvpB
MGHTTKLAAVVLLIVLALLGGFAFSNRAIRTEAKVLLGLEAPPQITPLAVVVPAPVRASVARPTSLPTQVTAPALPTVAGRAQPTRSAAPTATAKPTQTPIPPTPTPAQVVINGRVYDAYIPAVVKKGQLYQYTCEFDAAWVVLQTFGIDASVEEIIERTPFDTSLEPYYEETSDGFVIHGGDIRTAFAGDYKKSFLARTTGSALVPVFASFGLQAAPIDDRAGVEVALRRGALVWMKTTVDFKPWRPATWVTPDGSTIKTVLGNDHAVVVIGFNSKVVVIRDVLGPTSSNWRRPLEYEVDWDTFMKAWGAQSFDGLAIERPAA